MTMTATMPLTTKQTRPVPSSSAGTRVTMGLLPLLALWLGVFVEVVAHWANRVVNWLRYRNHKRRKLLRQMQKALAYEEWIVLGEQIDKLLGRDVWREEIPCPYYDTNVIQARLREFRTLKNTTDPWRVMFAIRAGLIRNYAGIGNAKLYSMCHVGTKRQIEVYFNTMLSLLDHVANLPETRLDFHSKLEFFGECRQSFGCSALVFNGGGTFGLIHLGVAKALFSVGLLPHVIAGSSTGALAAAIVCVHTDEELPALFQRGSISLKAFQRGEHSDSLFDALKRRLSRWWEHGVLMNIRVLEDALRDNIGDITFGEAFSRTGRILNIMVNSSSKHESPRLFNYLISPNVLIRTAACASLAVPGLFENVEIFCKDPSGQIESWTPPGLKWTSIELDNDLSINRLSELYNVNHLITVQVSPVIIPFLSSAAPTHSPGLFSKLRSLFFSEFRHRINQLTYLNLLPRWMHGLVNTLAQLNKGDVHIIPSISLVDYKNIVATPNEDVLNAAILKGQRSTWPHLNLIYHRMCLEKKVDEIFTKLMDTKHRRRREASPTQQRVESLSETSEGSEGATSTTAEQLSAQAVLRSRRKSLA